MNKKSQIKKIALMTSGGDAPGMNAAIRAVVRTSVYYEIEVTGIYRGYSGLIENDMIEMNARSVSKIINQGGTILKTSRSAEFMTYEGRKKAYDNLIKNNIDALIVIGGDGSFTGALKLYDEFNFPVMGIPGTIDNDLACTDYTLGYDTATNTVIESIDKIRDTANSHNRLFFIEVMGRDAGFIALRTGLATGAISILLPEQDVSIDDLIEILNKNKATRKTSSIVVVAEGDANGGAYNVAKKVKEKFSYLETKVTVLGHVQRGGSPSAFDRVMASRMGVKAVEGLLEGYDKHMVGFIKDDIHYCELLKAISGTHPINEELLRISKILSI
jgi:6-phosphofructokinase 1